MLTEEIVRTLRDLHARGRLNVREAAGIYGVAAETIRRALRGETWTHLQMRPPKSEEEWQNEAKASEVKLLAMLAAERKRAGAGDAMLEELAESTAAPTEDFMKGCGV